LILKRAGDGALVEPVEREQVLRGFGCAEPAVELREFARGCERLRVALLLIDGLKNLTDL
jgi:hypothetical protein